MLVTTAADEAVPSAELIWGETMPHVPMTEKNRMPCTSAVASPTLGAAELPAGEVLRWTCVTQPFSGPGYCQLLLFIRSGCHQTYLETLAAFSPIAGELFVELIVFQ